VSARVSSIKDKGIAITRYLTAIFRVDRTCLLVRWWWQKASRTQLDDKDSIAAIRLSESPIILQPASIQLPAYFERGGNPDLGVYREMVSPLLSGLHVLHQEVNPAFL
jgi:hypothetical protein